jgi:hypothetical protein
MVATAASAALAAAWWMTGTRRAADHAAARHVSRQSGSGVHLDLDRCDKQGTRKSDKGQGTRGWGAALVLVLDDLDATCHWVLGDAIASRERLAATKHQAADATKSDLLAVLLDYWRLAAGGW